MESHKSGNWIYVSDVKLAACLSAMGVQPRTPDPIDRISRNGQDPICYFYFNNSGLAADYVRAWECKDDHFQTDDRKHPLLDLDNPFWFIRAALRNRERYVDAVKQSKIIHAITKNGRTYLVTTNP